MSQFNYAGAATVQHLLAAVSAANTAAATGAAVDMIDYDSPVVITQSHGLGTGTLDGKIQDSPDGVGSWVDIAGATSTQSTTTADVKVLALNPKSCRRYIRYLGTIVTGPHLVSVSVAGVKKST